MRILRKYSNRRLYDTVASRYVNLDEVAALVREGEEIRVDDVRDGRDLTQEALLQVILDRDAGADLLPVPLLRRVIRLSGGGVADAAARQKLVTALAALHDQLDQIEGAWFRAGGTDAWAAAWAAWSGATVDDAPVDAPLADDDSEGLDVLRARLDALEERLRHGGR